MRKALPPKRKARAGHKAQKKVQEKELIIIDEKQGLIFENDKTLFGYFSVPIKEFENKFQKHYNPKNDFALTEQVEHESLLEETLDDPDEIWLDDSTFEDLSVHTMIKKFETIQHTFFYVAMVYISSDDNFPTFVFFHFPTRDPELVELFRENEIIFHRKLETIQFAALEGDSLLEGDHLAIGLLESMLKIRGDKDIPTDQFQTYTECRDSTIDSPDEIWRKVDTEGHVLVAFIKEFEDMGITDLHYIVITEEETESQVNSLLFSFPTNDISLVDRYRQGENLEAEEVATESSH
ncbi:MAG: peptidase [Bdellovibrionaceae bacterium]|nr:peptidase [Bdellovibrio sp.]